MITCSWRATAEIEQIGRIAAHLPGHRLQPEHGEIGVGGFRTGGSGIGLVGQGAALIDIDRNRQNIAHVGGPLILEERS
jgi:hypothetical protein